jgi:hypothetical protein
MPYESNSVVSPECLQTFVASFRSFAVSEPVSVESEPRRPVGPSKGLANPYLLEVVDAVLLDGRPPPPRQQEVGALEILPNKGFVFAERAHKVPSGLVVTPGS